MCWGLCVSWFKVKVFLLFLINLLYLSQSFGSNQKWKSAARVLIRSPLSPLTLGSDGLWSLLFTAGFWRHSGSLCVFNDWINRAVHFPGHVSVFCLSFALVTQSNGSVCWEYSSCQRWIMCVLHINPLVRSQPFVSL